ncbi:FtsB family cell division protein [Blautia sp. MSJ-19]|uniref:FtsB family cell division protein n=1 Tax=Blautia sp. MSJ-19 TaxID=2841517 RepID=UPI0020A10937|nr:septum formation initiator family protein [Blautia sp. MSJ-19]
MKQSKKRNNKKKIANNYLGMAAIAIVVLLLLGELTFQSQSLKSRIAVYDAKAEALQQSIEEEQDRTTEIDEQKDYMQTDEYIAEVARDKLGLVKSNEIVFEEEK